MNRAIVLDRLFDFQRFEANPHLAAVIADSESRVEGRRELEEDSLEVWAAGEPGVLKDPRSEVRKKNDSGE